jgi:hypothetical protein
MTFPRLVRVLETFGAWLYSRIDPDRVPGAVSRLLLRPLSGIDQLARGLRSDDGNHSRIRI